MKFISVTNPQVAAAIADAGHRLAGVPVTLTRAGDLVAVLCKEERRPLLSIFSRRAELMRLVDHQRLLEELVALGPMLPARPDAKVAGEAEARALLEFHGALFEEQLSKFGRTLQYQIMVEDAAEAQSSRERVTDLVRAGCKDLIRLPSDTEDMIVNAVVLVDRGRESELERQLEAIDALFSGGCRIRMIGPLPPVSFAAIDIAPVDEKAVRAAEELLDVTADATSESLRRAYLALVSRHHPDRAGANDASAEGSETRVGAASEAYKLLTRYRSAAAGRERVLFVDVVRQNEAMRKAA